MVKSRLHKDIQYKETYAIDPDDIGFETSIYEITLFDEDVEIALGKPKYEYSSKHIIYFPVYLLVNEDPVSKIGIYELPDNQMIQSMDEDEDYEINEKNVILYIKKEYYTKIMKKNKKDRPETLPLPTPPPPGAAADVTHTPPLPPPQDEDVFTLKIPLGKQSPAVKAAEETTKHGIFVNNPTTIIAAPPQQLPEETAEDAAEYKKQFKEGPRNIWLKNFMKNDNYNIIDNEGGGDCFFAVIRDAFKQIGKDTTVEKLRALLSREATEELYQNYRSLYMMFLGNFQENEKKLKSIKDNSKIIKKRITNSDDKRINEELLQQAKKLVAEYKDVEKENVLVREYMQEFDFMKDITNLEKLREFIQTREFWADTWAISTLEKLLNIKVVIFSQQSFQEGDLDSVLKCGQLNDSDLERQGNFKPDFYIMTAYKNNNHYMLITYNDRNIFKFPEVPFGVKSLVVNKCMERNSGPYYLIEDFRSLKTKLGLPPNEGEYESDEDADEGDTNKTSQLHDIDLYNKDVVFQFYSKSDPKPKTGRGSGEKIPDIRLLDFTELNKIPNWRRMLDDTWTTKFEVDGKKWQSVEHYMLGAQFRKGFPHFYIQFSLDSGSDMSRDLDMARLAGENAVIRKDVMHKDVKLRDKHITIDPDFYEVKMEPRHERERIIALQSKFTQNLDLKHVLLETKDAKLVRFVRSKPTEPDMFLMKLRKKITK